ncbi:MAG: peptide chain release factor N(5)-glutamine methyltransferase, partial [Dongiaceae bacterium]
AMRATSDRLLGYPEAPVEARAARGFAAALDRRLAREPVSRILGEREFWSLPFRLGAATLDPRPDSETLIAAVLARVVERSAPLRLLDLGTGTGCLLLALLSELPRARGIGIDLASSAVAVATENAMRLGLGRRALFRIGDWDRGLAGRFDIVVSNPPYIPHREIEALAPEVRRYDPRLALDGGADGLAGHRALAGLLPRRLTPRGIAAIELGAGQGPAAAAIYEAAGVALLDRVADLSETLRCLVLGGNPRKITVGKRGPTV